MAHVPLTLRRAGAEDALALWSWRNEAGARAVSGSTEAVPWAEHVEWFRTSIAGTDRHILIASQDVDIGMVRFDRLAAAGAWRVSINLAPEMRGRGFGGRVLRQAESWLAARTVVVTIVADVASSNPPSIRVFESSGYRLVTEADGWRRYVLART